MRPGWAKTLGILMILISGCGVTNDIKWIKTAELTELQEDIFNELDTEFNKEELDSTQLALLEKLSGLENNDESKPANVRDHIDAITNIPEKDLESIVLFGYIGLFISVLYAIAGLLLLFRRKHVLKVVFGTLIISLTFVAYQILGISNFNVSKIFRIGLEFITYFGGLLDIMILIVLAIVNKDYFQDIHESGDYYDKATLQ